MNFIGDEFIGHAHLSNETLEKVGFVETFIYRARKLFLLQARTLVMIFLGFLVFQKVLSTLILNVLLTKIIMGKKLKCFSVGLILFTFFSRIKLCFLNGTDIIVSKMKLQKKLIDDSGKKTLLIDLIDLSISIPNISSTVDPAKQVDHKHKKENSEDTLMKVLNKLENIEYRTLFKYKWLLKLVLFFIPLQLSLQKVKLRLREKEFYADYISIRFTYNKVAKTCSVSLFVHEFNDYQNLVLKSFEFEIQGDWEIDYKREIFSFTKYSSNLKVANLDLTLNSYAPHCKSDHLSHSEAKKQTDEKLMKICNEKNIMFQKYKNIFSKICSFLNVVEFKVEDINFKIPNYHANLYCAAMTMRFSAIDSLKMESGYEFTLSSNTVNLKIYENKIISLPLLSMFLIGDSLYHLRDDDTLKYNVKCILTCIDCNVVIGEKHVEYFIQNFIKNKKPKVHQETSESSPFEKHKNDELLSLFLYFLNFFSFDFKFLIPNASFTYLIGDSNITIKNNQSVFHVKSPKDVYVLYEELMSDALYDYDEDLRLTETLSSLKTSDISIDFNDFVGQEYLITPLFALKKFEIQNYQNNLFQLDNLLLGSELKLSNLNILKRLHNAVLELKSVWHTYASNAHLISHKPKSKTENLFLSKLNCRSRIIDSYFVNAFSEVIKKELDPSKELFDKFYGFQGFIKNMDFKVHNHSKRFSIDIIHLSLIERSETLNSAAFKAGKLEDITVDLSDGTDVLINSATFKTELATVWTIFYLISAYKNAFPSSNKEKAEKSTIGKENVNKKKFNAKISNVLLDSNMVDDLNILFSLKDISITQNLIGIRLIQTFNESTYGGGHLQADAHETIFTRLLKIKDAIIDTRKESLLDQFSVLLDVKTFEMRSEYHLKFYKIFDRIVSTFKSFKQLKTGLSDLDKFIHNQPTSVSPISIPAVKIKVDKFLVKVDEDPFEHQLNLIYKIGLGEQRVRMDKELIFQEELEKLMRKKAMNAEEIADAKYRLLKNFSTSWIERVKTARNEFLNVHAYDIIEREYLDRKVKIYAGHERIPLMVYSLMKMDFVFKQPDFGVENYAEFIHKYGKGVPVDSIYTLLILSNIKLSTKLLKLQLRDYTLPILHFPNMILSGDMVLGETMPDDFGIREVWVPFIHGCSNTINNVFGSNIIRTINSVKFYMNLTVSIDSPQPTILTWGKSLQPAIQAVMMWFDFLTKPPLDPSPKIGFWDKIRLLAHGVIKFEWAETSELHLNMKGSTDPYDIHEFGAGLTFCWKGGTTLTVHENSKPSDFLQIKSKSFILGIRNFDALYQEDKFSKILMVLNGDVLWRLGLMFELGDIKKPGQTKRSCDFVPHYTVYLANPKLLKHEEGHDSFKKFRSDFIHMDIGVYSDGPNMAKNSLHLAPFCSEHFLAWWKLFGTYTSGPIRQGPLFPSMQQSSTKFGRSLFTLKYQMSFAPLEMAHVYRHSASENTNSEDSVFTGLKGKFDIFKLDLHQKRSPVTLNNDLLNRTKREWKLKMDQGEVDFMNADIRLIHSIFNKNSHTETLSESSDEFSWYDLLDYTDMDGFEGLPLKPKILQTIPLLHSERISYFRNIERKVFPVDYPFGNEQFHNCLAGKNNSELTQLQIYDDRLTDLEQMISKLEIGESDDRNSQLLNHKVYEDRETLEYFNKQKIIIKDLIEQFEPMRLKIEKTTSTVSLGSEDLEMINPIPTLLSKKDEDLKFKRSGHTTTFDNKFVVHNMKLKLNEMSKKLLLAYSRKLEERKTTSFYDSYKSLSIIKELLEYSKDTFRSSRLSNEANNNSEYDEQLDYHVKFDSMENSECIKQFEEIIRSISDVNFFSSDHMVLKFIMPQIQLCSNLVENWGTVLLANEIEVGIIDIIQGRDSTLVLKSIENLRETRICMLLSEVKFFSLDKESVLSHPCLKYEIDDRETTSGRGWIPSIPVEAFIDSSSLEKFKIFAKSSMFLTFSNPNDLFYDKISHRVYNDDPILRIGVPEMHIQSTSKQYNAILTIFDDLLTFNSKENKKWETLTKTFLADEMKKNFFTTAQFIINLQKKIRAIRFERSIMKGNDPEVFNEMKDRVEKELDSDRFELRLMMTSLKKGLTTNKKRNGNKEISKQLWYISADDVIWDLYEEPNVPFITFGLGFSSFQRTSYSDGSTSNKLMIYTLHCFNLDKKALYGELISPLKELNKTPAPLLQLFWRMDKPVGGISQIEAIDLKLRALRVQLEHKILEKIVSFLLSDSNGGEEKHNTKGSSKNSIDSDSQSSSHKQDPSKTIYLENSLITPGYGISEMVKRSNKYMAIKKIVINKTVLSVSYRGSKKITNLNDLAVKIPVLKYENKIWSTEDFISALKRDLIKIVLSHTGNIIGNKFKTNKKIESRYESFKQFSKLLRADSALERNQHQAAIRDQKESLKKEVKPGEMPVIEENDSEEETESIKEFKKGDVAI